MADPNGTNCLILPFRGLGAGDATNTARELVLSLRPASIGRDSNALRRVPQARLQTLQSQMSERLAQHPVQLTAQTLRADRHHNPTSLLRRPA